MWDGVRVLSSFDLYGPPQQSWPGQVRMESGARIQNALVGVLCGEGDPANPGYVNSTPGTYGGVIETRDAVFENNRFDVVAKQWVSNTGTPSSSLEPEPCQARIRFVNTTFRTTAPLLYAGLHPVAHLRVADNQPFVHGCTFANELPAHTSSLEMGHGIEALNANLRVEPCLSGPCLAGSDQGNTFRNLDHAIHAVATESAPYSTIRDNTFIDNICAVYMDAVPGFAIRGNEVEMGRWSDVELTGTVDAAFLDYHRGIFSTLGFGFNISENNLGRSAGGTALTEGIVVGYTQEHNDIVFNNTAGGLDVGFVGEGICADVDGILGNANTQGLQFQCNTNANNGVNIWSRKIVEATDQIRHTIRGYQGGDGTVISPARAASNTFDRTAGNIDFRVSTDYLPLIRYFHKATPTNKIPLFYTTGTPALSPQLIGAGALDACATPGIWPGGTKPTLRAELESSKVAHGNISYLMAQLIDGGNTAAVVQEIIDTWPQDIWDLRAYLLSKSPYLSAEALKQLMNKDVPLAMKAEILIANPEATQKEGFLKWAELEANYPLPEYIIASVIASWDTRTYRSTLEMQMAEKHTALSQAANGLLYLYQTDTVPADPDSLRWVWQQVRTNGARYAEAALLLGQGNFTEAQTVIAAMPSEKNLRAPEELERQRMLTYISVLATAAGDGRNAYQLNTGEVNTLENMAKDHYDRPSRWANNLLCAVYKKCQAPWTGGDSEPKSRHYLPQAPVAVLAHGLLLQPNPAAAWTTASFTLPEATQGAWLQVQDLTGRKLHEERVAGAQGQVLLDTRSYAPGSYVLVLRDAHTVLGTERLIIQH
jgi:hypothetical protein